MPAPPAAAAYLDHNATTPVRPEVLDAMLPYLRERFGNPNSPYRAGQEARRAVEAAREQVARLLSAQPEEIVFTSCGSESDVLAIAGAAQRGFERSGGAKRHLVSSAVEHDAVREALKGLRGRGFETTWAGVDGHGRVDPAAVRAALRPETLLASIMHANNEVGTVQPIAEIAAACRERGVLFHTDAVQSAGKLPIDVRRLNVDLLALSGHKLNAPKGVGALFVRQGVRLSPVVTGHQERNRRGGTENVAGIVGLGRACELAAAELEAHARELAALVRRIEDGCRRIPGSRLNGHPEHRLPNTCHVSFEGLEGFQLVVALDLLGISVSSGPACSTGAAEPSHVLEAMGLEPRWSAGALRISLGWGSTAADVDRLLQALPGAVERLRAVGAPT
ncbi:MAG: cysteine desulfurase [Elusimicrobia bacterium]|nr:cysteine desulfurase [Elusimicrobiota bacterium]